MSWFSRLKNALHPGRLDEELADEMRDHLERRAAALREKGLSPGESQRQAALRFGNITRAREQSRDIRLWAALDSMLQDMRYAWRTMRRSPAFAATAVLSLSLAIGANTAIFSLVDAAMLRPLPVADPERLVLLTWPDIDQPGNPAVDDRDSFSYPLYLQLREAAGPSAHVGLFAHSGRSEVKVGGAEAPLEHAIRQFVSGDAFDLLGVPPALGRVFSRDDDHIPGGHPLAVLGYEYWASRFAADPATLGRSLQVDGKTYTIIGIARKGFFGVEPGKVVDIWLPAMMYDASAFDNPGWGWFRIIGRTMPGFSREQLQVRLQPPFHRNREQAISTYPSIPPGIRKQFLEATIRVRPGATGASVFRKTFARPLWIVLGVAAIMLLIACANVASLLLARSIARSPEMAMRVSLGAARGRLVRQLLTESLLLSTLAGGIGWLFARAAAPALVNLLSKDTDPVRFALAMDSRMLLFCVAVATLAAVFFGLLPAWQTSGAQPVLALRGAIGQAGKLRMGRLFVGVQVAFAFCLVMTGAAFLFSLRNLVSVDTGFDPHGVTVLGIGAEIGKQSPEAQRQFMDRFQRRIASLPGIQACALAPWAIFEGSGWTDQVIVPGKPPAEREEIFYRVSPGYFSTLRTPLLAGRDFEARDSDLAGPVPTIVNLAFARKYFDGGSPLGREFERPQREKRVRHRIVGVVANAYYGDLRHGAEPMVYVPLEGVNYFSAYLRSPLGAGPVAREAEREAQAIGSGARVREVTTLDTLVGNTLLREKLLAGVGGVFALLGLLLAAIGMFGLLNYSVSRRTREIGIRTALGAQRREIVVLVLRDLAALAGGGLVAGLAASLAVIAVLQSLLFGIRPVDPLVMGTAAVVFLAAATIAGGLPARRAAAVDPTVVLRYG
jgi:predicted permease